MLKIPGTYFQSPGNMSSKLSINNLGFLFCFVFYVNRLNPMSLFGNTFLLNTKKQHESNCK